MTSMREKIARAAFVALWGYEPSEGVFDGAMAPKSKSGQALAVTHAVLDALAEPTEGMVEAGRWPAEDDGPLACFRAMILAAKEGK